MTQLTNEDISQNIAHAVGTNAYNLIRDMDLGHPDGYSCDGQVDIKFDEDAVHHPREFKFVITLKLTNNNGRGD